MGAGLYERIVSGEPVRDLDLRRRSMSNEVRGATFVRLDNVTDFISSTKRDLYWEDDFPNIAPPWPRAFYEWKSMGRGNKHSVGVDVYSFKISEIPKEETVRRILKDYGIADTAFNRSMWVCVAHCFCGLPDEIIIQTSRFNFFVCLDGRLMPSSVGCQAAFRMAPEFKGSPPFEYEAPCVCFAITLTHCKNVELRHVVPDKKLARAQLKRHGIPKLSYDVIDIVPAQNILRTEGGLDQHGSLKQALHLCRGHFKDYRQRGLFGKNKGLYWWPLHARGSLKNGIASRDYTIHP